LVADGSLKSTGRNATQVTQHSKGKLQALFLEYEELARDEVKVEWPELLDTFDAWQRDGVIVNGDGALYRLAAARPVPSTEAGSEKPTSPSTTPAAQTTRGGPRSARRAKNDRESAVEAGRAFREASQRLAAIDIDKTRRKNRDGVPKDALRLMCDLASLLTSYQRKWDVIARDQFPSFPHHGDLDDARKWLVREKIIFWEVRRTGRGNQKETLWGFLTDAEAAC
jgi:hypothetical protein